MGHAVSQVLFKNWALSSTCTTKINGTTVDNSEDLDLVLSM